MIAASPSMKKSKSGDRNACSVISASLTVTELRSISSVTSRTLSCIIAFTSFTPSVKQLYSLVTSYITVFNSFSPISTHSAIQLHLLVTRYIIAFTSFTLHTIQLPLLVTRCIIFFNSFTPSSYTRRCSNSSY